MSLQRSIKASVCVHSLCVRIENKVRWLSLQGFVELNNLSFEMSRILRRVQLYISKLIHHTFGVSYLPFRHSLNMISLFEFLLSLHFSEMSFLSLRQKKMFLPESTLLLYVKSSCITENNYCPESLDWNILTIIKGTTKEAVGRFNYCVFIWLVAFSSVAKSDRLNLKRV